MTLPMPESVPFQESLLRLIERKDHAAWPRWSGPGIALRQLQLHFEQEWLVFVRDFPLLLGRVHGNCPVPAVRRALAANLYEEETGGLSGTRPHPELFLQQMAAIGLDPAAFETARLLPEAAAYRAWIDHCTRRDDWWVGAAVVTLWIEGSVHERRSLAGAEPPLEQRIAANFLVRHHGLPPTQLVLARAHDAVEGGHRRDAWEMVLGHARGPEREAQVLDALKTCHDLWHLYRDAVTRAAGV